MFKTETQIRNANIIVISFFLLIGMVHIMQLNDTWIGVIRELLTLPFLILQVFLLVLSVRLLIKHRPKPITLTSIIALFVSSIITMGSFFI